MDPVTRITAGACLLGAGFLHAVVVAPHHVDWAPSGTFFLILELMQIGLGLVLLLDDARLTRPAAAVAGALSLGVLALYVVSRTIGVPIGPDQVVGPVGVVDAVTGLLEVITVLATTAMLRPTYARPSTTAGDHRVIAVVVIVVTTLCVFAVISDTTGEELTAPSTSERNDDGLDRRVGAPPGTVVADQSIEIAALSASFSGGRNFDRSEVRLSAGAAAVIRFVNEDDAAHNLSLYRPGSRGEALFVGDTIGAGESVDYPFTTPEPGGYVLRCDLHPWMQGSLVTS